MEAAIQTALGIIGSLSSTERGRCYESHIGSAGVSA